MLANAPGTAILNQTIDPLSFYGPPLILIGDGLSGTSDPRWVAAAAFAVSVGAHNYDAHAAAPMVAPLIGIDTLSGTYAADIAALQVALLACSSFFDVPRTQGFVWCAADAVQPRGNYPICGPILAAPSGSALNVRSEAWRISALFLRLSCNNLYGIGCMACGGTVPEHAMSPPVYDMTAQSYDVTKYAKTFNTMLNVWRNAGPVFLDGFVSLQALESDPTRLGISRRTHPALLGLNLLLTTPS